MPQFYATCVKKLFTQNQTFIFYIIFLLQNSTPIHTHSLSLSKSVHVFSHIYILSLSQTSCQEIGARVVAMVVYFILSLGLLTLHLSCLCEAPINTNWWWVDSSGFHGNTTFLCYAQSGKKVFKQHNALLEAPNKLCALWEWSKSCLGNFQYYPKNSYWNSQKIQKYITQFLATFIFHKNNRPHLHPPKKKKKHFQSSPNTQDPNTNIKIETKITKTDIRKHIFICVHPGFRSLQIEMKHTNLYVKFFFVLFYVNYTHWYP